MKKYMCLICGHIYDEALGDPDTGVAPGTKWEDVPPNWTCPDCGARQGKITGAINSDYDR
jgi:rubredoxin